jgi:transposase
MDAHEDTPRIQVLSVSDTGRRRRWTDAEKRRIVEESHLGGSTIADVARRHEISRSMLYDWRYRHRLGLLGGDVRFTPLIAVDDAAVPVSINTLPLPQSLMTIEVADRYRITLPADFDMDAATRLIKGLVVRR